MHSNDSQSVYRTITAVMQSRFKDVVVSSDMLNCETDCEL